MACCEDAAVPHLAKFDKPPFDAAIHRGETGDGEGEGRFEVGRSRRLEDGAAACTDRDLARLRPAHALGEATIRTRTELIHGFGDVGLACQGQSQWLELLRRGRTYGQSLSLRQWIVEDARETL